MILNPLVIKLILWITGLFDLWISCMQSLQKSVIQQSIILFFVLEDDIRCEEVE